ncbi:MULTISPECIES: NAD(P)H-binding protein [Tsukamurella]|uniref:NAD-dependent epimerase/dehydratase family protein n=2 Tax=Tsukamurella TaxID=2060 RepID=A0A5C5RTL2_9ACTN|nr:MULTISPECIES: NAD(P)H-binding protein [Tsukamurella]NMD55619.1 NAD(P)H-binding protein [Tsukamurella columbiensis]TWS25551.1 NAD-dependent epimerase/dehydratase family protein [Tsukamurella conjunctivitidis]
MILVTGATGVIGQRVVAQLVADGVSVRATSRNPASADLPNGVERADSAAPARALLDGCSAALVVASALGAAQEERLTALVEAATVAASAPAPSGVVEAVTGRPARRYAQWVADHAELFR